MTPKQNMSLCEGCDRCCNHIALEIDRPTSKEDYDHIIWYLMHENVSVSIDNDNDWIIEFRTPCKALTKGKMCAIYGERPEICRKYSQENCVRYGEGAEEKMRFENREDFIRYLESRNIDWKFKKHDMEKK